MLASHRFQNRNLGFNLAGHAAEIDGYSFEEFALVFIGRKFADQVAIFRFRKQLVELGAKVIHHWKITVGAIKGSRSTGALRLRTRFNFAVQPILFNRQRSPCGFHALVPGVCGFVGGALGKLGAVLGVL